MALAKVCFIDTVDLGEFDVGVLQGSRSFFIMRSQCFTMTTPKEGKIRVLE